MSIISCFTKNLRPDYFSIIDQILRYLASSLKKALYLKENLNLILFDT